MITVKSLIPVLEEFHVGDISSRTILPPDAVALDQVLDARVASIGAKDGTPIVWISLTDESYDFDFED